jgi:probable F420-dependent oxidoreductase
MKADFYFPSGQLGAVSVAAHRARSVGYDGFFTAETQHDPFLPLALAAAAEPDLELGTAIAVAFPRSPMVVAMTAWDLAQASAGKFMLGLGTQVRGHIVRRFSSVWDKPGPQLREYLMALRAIWDTWQNSVPLRFEGGYYQFSLMTPFFDPGPIKYPDIPLYIAGVGPYLSRLAGEMCQGFHVHPFHTVAYLDQVVLPAISAGAADNARSIDDVDLVSTVFVVTGETESDVEQSMEPVRQQISFYASTPSYQPVLEANGWDFGEKLNAMSKRGQWDQMPGVVPDEAVMRVAVTAPLDRLGQAIRERYGDRIQRVGLYTIGAVPGMDDDATRHVIGQLKA